MASPIEITSVIMKQLAGGEMRVLRLVVAVRTALEGSGKIKGDLPEIVKSALRKLVASQAIIDVDGMYSLSPPR